MEAHEAGLWSYEVSLALADFRDSDCHETVADAVDSPVEEADIVHPDTEAGYSSVAAVDFDSDCAVADAAVPLVELVAAHTEMGMGHHMEKEEEHRIGCTGCYLVVAVDVAADTAAEGVVVAVDTIAAVDTAAAALAEPAAAEAADIAVVGAVPQPAAAVEEHLAHDFDFEVLGRQMQPCRQFQEYQQFPLAWMMLLEQQLVAAIAIAAVAAVDSHS